MIRHRKPALSREALIARLGVGAALTFVVLVVLSYPRLEGQEPQVLFDREFEALGRTPSLLLTVEDPATGLKQVRVVLTQEDGEVVLVEESFDGPGAAGPVG